MVVLLRCLPHEGGEFETRQLADCLWPIWRSNSTGGAPVKKLPRTQGVKESVKNETQYFASLMHGRVGRLGSTKTAARRPGERRLREACGAQHFPARLQSNDKMAMTSALRNDKWHPQHGRAAGRCPACRAAYRDCLGSSPFPGCCGVRGGQAATGGRHAGVSPCGVTHSLMRDSQSAWHGPCTCARCLSSSLHGLIRAGCA